MHAPLPTIGILGGMGPYPGLDLARHIMNHTAASADRDHLPLALLSAPHRIPDRNGFLLGASTPSPAPALTELAEELAGLGARLIGIPCNTAHAPSIFEPLTEALARTHPRVRLLHLIDETARYVATRYPNIERAGVLSTLALYRLELYPEALAREGITPVTPDPDVQERLISPVIFDPDYGLKAQSSPPTPRARRDLRRGLRHLKEQGAQAVILGCSELPLGLPAKMDEGLVIIDPLVALARALISAAAPKKLRPLD